MVGALMSLPLLPGPPTIVPRDWHAFKTLVAKQLSRFRHKELRLAALSPRREAKAREVRGMHAGRGACAHQTLNYATFLRRTKLLGRT